MAALACERCGRVDPTLRVAVFPWVVSIVVMSYKRAKAGIFCSACRSSERWKYFGLSALLGWWGLPWGLFWTLEALADNAAGGKLPKPENASLLAALGQQLWAGGERDRAREAWSASLALENNPQLERAVLMLDTTGRANGSVRATSVRPGEVVRIARPVHIRASPDESSALIGTSPAGSAHVALATRDGWTQIRLGAGVAGWVQDSELAT